MPSSHLPYIILGDIYFLMCGAIHKDASGLGIEQLGEDQPIAKSPEKCASVVEIGISCDDAQPEVSEQGQQACRSGGERDDEDGVAGV